MDVIERSSIMPKNVRHGFGVAHGRRSRGNFSHTGGHEPKHPVPLDAPHGMCWGCWQNKREPWEHAVTCVRWHEREGCASGT